MFPWAGLNRLAHAFFILSRHRSPAAISIVGNDPFHSIIIENNSRVDVLNALWLLSLSTLCPMAR